MSCKQSKNRYFRLRPSFTPPQNCCCIYRARAGECLNDPLTGMHLSVHFFVGTYSNLTRTQPRTSLKLRWHSPSKSSSNRSHFGLKFSWRMSIQRHGDGHDEGHCQGPNLMRTHRWPDGLAVVNVVVTSVRVARVMTQSETDRLRFIIYLVTDGHDLTVGRHILSTAISKHDVGATFSKFSAERNAVLLFFLRTVLRFRCTQKAVLNLQAVTLQTFQSLTYVDEGLQNAADPNDPI